MYYKFIIQILVNMNKNNIQLNWAHICHDISIDQTTNNISLFNIIEELTIKRDPFAKLAKEKAGHTAVPVKLEFISLWSKASIKKSIKFDVGIALVSPKGRVIHEIKQSINIPDGKLRSRLRFGIRLIGIEGDGMYNFKIKAKTKKGGNFIHYKDVSLYVKFDENKANLKQATRD